MDRRLAAAMRSSIKTLSSLGATVVLLTAPYYQQPERADGSRWPSVPTRRPSPASGWELGFMGISSGLHAFRMGVGHPAGMQRPFFPAVDLTGLTARQISIGLRLARLAR